MDAGLSYRAGNVAGASPVALVARLYEQMIHDLRQAMNALEQNDIELRTGKINHAVLVIGYLESQLNFDAGGKVAENLKNFYHSLRENLLQAQLQQSTALLARQITDLLAVREAWIEVERAEGSATATAADLATATAPVSTSGAPRVDWKG